MGLKLGMGPLSFDSLPMLVIANSTDAISWPMLSLLALLFLLVLFLWVAFVFAMTAAEVGM